MSDALKHPAVERLLKSPAIRRTLDLLASDLPGADATSVLLDAMAQRSANLGAADVLAQYRRDRFVAPAAVDPIRVARLQLHALEFLTPDFVPVETSPLAPLGTHSVVAGVHQNNVVSTVRMTEVAADPTNQLALEAAVRRRQQLSDNVRSGELVRLCSVDRVVRAQLFADARSFAHFSLLGLLVGGRDRGSGRFEAGALAEILAGLTGFVTEATGLRSQIALSDFDGGFHAVLDEVSERLGTGRVRCSIDHDRELGRGYYTNVCFKLSVEADGELLEVGDGGSVDWATALCQDKKERLLIGGLSLERLALI
ncbi:MAG: hypothetical protein HKN03_16150 [Acidimicrobiales bacterium]|nr:hypothetical protein [Acidimicrobiales bacterium]